MGHSHIISQQGWNWLKLHETLTKYLYTKKTGNRKHTQNHRQFMSNDLTEGVSLGSLQSVESLPTWSGNTISGSSNYSGVSISIVQFLLSWSTWQPTTCPFASSNRDQLILPTFHTSFLCIFTRTSSPSLKSQYFILLSWFAFWQFANYLPFQM